METENQMGSNPPSNPLLGYMLGIRPEDAK